MTICQGAKIYIHTCHEYQVVARRYIYSYVLPSVRKAEIATPTNQHTKLILALYIVETVTTKRSHIYLVRIGYFSRSIFFSLCLFSCMVYDAIYTITSYMNMPVEIVPFVPKSKVHFVFF